jgi:aspartate carbamoyltransferase
MRGKSIISVDQFNRNSIKILFETADGMRKLVKSKGGNNILSHKIMTALFYEPSSRTFGSFTAAMQRLGGAVIPIQGVKFSSVSKGETLEDTIRVFGNYSDLIVFRHPKIGSAKRACKVSYVPIINAGDGSGEHPTQALLDLYTISGNFDLSSKITVAMVGDLRFGRTTHSLSRLLSNYKNVKQLFVAPDLLKIPEYIKTHLENNAIQFNETSDFNKALKEADVLYMTRVQKERFSNIEEYAEVKDLYIFDKSKIKLIKKNMIIMHPLPRVNEISTDIDSDSRALYLKEQMKNGLYIRMAMLKLILS